MFLSSHICLSCAVARCCMWSCSLLRTQRVSRNKFSSVCCVKTWRESNDSLQVDRRGFFPKGGGRCLLTARCLPAGSHLPALDLTERGELRSVIITAFAAGQLKVAVAERMARAAEAALREVHSPGCQVLHSHTCGECA